MPPRGLPRSERDQARDNQRSPRNHRTGHAVGVQQGGKFYQRERKIRISALLKNLPDKVTVDISSLGLDKRIKAGDITVDNATVLTGKDTIICGVKATRNSAAQQ